MIPTGQEEGGGDQEIIHILQLTTDFSRRTTLMIWLTLAMAVTGKGNAAPWIAKRVADWLGWLGSQTVTQMCDNEPAILALSQEIRRLRREGSITIFQHLEEGEKQSNHRAEGSVNVVKGFFRTLKSSTESNLRIEIGPSRPLMPWIIEHAAQLRNRHMVCADGRTPTERLRGRGVQLPVYELGEKVLFLPLAPARRGDFGARFDYGIYLGCRSLDGQAYVGTIFRSGQMQDSATAQCSGEMGHRSRAEHQRNPVVSRRGACRRCQHPCGSP